MPESFFFFKSSKTITLIRKLLKHSLQRLSKAKQEFVQTFERCSSQTLPTLWWRKEAELGSCLLLHQSHSSVETPAAPGAESPPPVADSCHLQNSLLHSGALAANNIEEQQLQNHDCLSVQQPQLKLNAFSPKVKLIAGSSLWVIHKYFSYCKNVCSKGYSIMLGKCRSTHP